MPLTKLARRYHMQRRPDENGFATPSRSSVEAKKALDFETPELPPYVTVRKRKPAISCETIHTTVLESENFAVTDCQSWKRLESTHVDHIAEALGHMTIWTEDISAIHAEESFRTALESQGECEERRRVSPSFEESGDNCSKHVISESSLSSTFARTSKWVLDSPFQSPRQSPAPLIFDTIVISESDSDDDDNNSSAELTSNISASAKPRKSPSLTSADNTRHINETPDNEIINEIWQLDASTNSVAVAEEESPMAPSRSVNLQVSFTSSKNDEYSIEDGGANCNSSVAVAAEEKITKDQSLQVSMVSSRSVSLQVSLTSPVGSDDEDEIENCGEGEEVARAFSSPSTTTSSRDLGENSKELEHRNTLSDVSSHERNSQGNVLFLEDEDDDEVERKKRSELSFLTSLSLEEATSDCHPDAVKYVKNFNKNKEELLQRLFVLFNKEAFDNILPADTTLLWNTRLTKTAGVCVQRKIRLNNQEEEERISKIELSSKVIDSPDRLRDTLIHEMCHAAAWIRSGVRDGHGAFWKGWAQKAMSAFPQLPIIARCHSYVIRTKFTYVCQKCGQRLGRHSKSINVDKQLCKLCGGRFLLVNNCNRRKP